MGKDMQGKSADLVNLSSELLQKVLLDITWEYMQKMTDCIRGIDDSHMR